MESSSCWPYIGQVNKWVQGQAGSSSVSHDGMYVSLIHVVCVIIQ